MKSAAIKLGANERLNSLANTFIPKIGSSLSRMMLVSVVVLLIASLCSQLIIVVTAVASQQNQHQPQQQSQKDYQQVSFGQCKLK